MESTSVALKGSKAGDAVELKASEASQVNEMQETNRTDSSGVSPAKKAKTTDETIEDGQKEKQTLQGNETANAMSEKSSNNTKNTSISLKSQAKTVNKAATNITASDRIAEQLLVVISNQYLKVGHRLRLDFWPRCLDDLSYCHAHHYSSDMPEVPIRSQALYLRSAMQQFRFVSFINTTLDMCHRRVFPGTGIFRMIIEMILSINYETKGLNRLVYMQSYHKAIELFSTIVRTFPPCWQKIRLYYMLFLERDLDQSKLCDKKKDALSKSSKIFDIVLDLLDSALQEATAEELTADECDSISSACEQPAQEEPQNSQLSQQPNSMDTTLNSEIWTPNEYEESERQRQTYSALPMRHKIERIFTCLRLLLEILEHDLSMWMLHHFRKTKDYIFFYDKGTILCPLIVVLCEMNQFTRMTRVTRRIFTVYSEAVAKGLCRPRLLVLERYISLLMVANNMADMENTAVGVKYPVLGAQTKTLIKEFFKIFKGSNHENIGKYMDTIEMLRVPFVRFEFIDNVLFSNMEPLTPKKIAMDLVKKRWLKYKPSSEMSKDSKDISREQYLHLLLDALRQYCDWHGIRTIWNAINTKKDVEPLSTTNDSVHRWPVKGNGVLMLTKMAKEIQQLEQQVRMSVKMSKPKVTIPLADIYVDEALIQRYRQDIKCLIYLQNVLLKQKAEQLDVDFGEWLAYLKHFTPMKAE